MPSLNKFLCAPLLAAMAGAVLAAPSNGVQNRVDYTSDVVYQIVTDRFLDGNPANNPGAGHSASDCTKTELYCGGDWQGIINKIEDGYLGGMGVSVILISPPVQNSDVLFSGLYSSYHGYWPVDLKRSNPAFGTMDDFKRLVKVAHAHGIKVMIDFITNQTSPALEEDPGFGDNGKLYDDGKLLSAFSDDEEGKYHHYGETDFSSIEDELHKSLYNLADLDQQHPQIDRYLKEAVKFWLDAGIDGLRVDTVKHVSTGWQRSWMDAIYAHRPVFTAGEWYVSRDDVWGPSFDFANQSGMSVLDFPFAQTTREVFRYRSKDMPALDQMIERTGAAYAHPLDQLTFIDNHDQNRVTLSDSAAHHRQTEQAMAFSMTSRGTPVIYYGTEQYLLGPGHAPINRALMPSFDTSTPLYGMIRRLAALKKSNPALQFGDQQRRWLNADVYIYERSFHGNRVLVAINKSISVTADVKDLRSGLPCAKGGPLSYADVLEQQFGGAAIEARCDGTVAPFQLAPGAIAVWAAREDDTASQTPALGHAGPMLGRAGVEVVLSGQHFGTSRGSVLFGQAAADILEWEDSMIKVRVPAIAAGRYDLTVRRKERGSAASEAYKNFEVLGGPQQSLRIIVDQALAAPDEQVYLLGDVHELGGNQPAHALGPMFDKVVYRRPTWYLDVSVPVNSALSYRFMKKKTAGGEAVMESGPPHTVTTSAAGSGVVRVKLNGWNAAEQKP